jgi:microcystin-dependent protein
MMASVSIPTGYLECNGASVLRTDYPALFAVVGTIWGTAAITHFNLPDMRGMFPRGWSNTSTNMYVDPDRLARTALYTGGVTGNKVGSYQ